MKRGWCLGGFNSSGLRLRALGGKRWSRPKPGRVAAGFSPHGWARLLLVLLWAASPLAVPAPAATNRVATPNSNAFGLEAGAAGITSLKHLPADPSLQFVRPKHVLGDMVLRTRANSEPWRESSLLASADVRQFQPPPPGQQDLWIWNYSGRSTSSKGLRGLDVRQVFALENGALRWRIKLRNPGPHPVEIGDLALPLPMNTDYDWNHEETFERRVFKHAFIAGHGSFLYWLPVKGTGPILLMVPEGDTHLEYFTETDMDYAFGRGRYTVFVHSGASASLDARGTWRQPRTTRLLQPGAEADYGFSFHWADDYEQARRLLFDQGGCAVRVAPGLVVPVDLEARLALSSKTGVLNLEAEFPDQTRIEHLDGPTPAGDIYRLRFNRLGENRVTVHFPGGRTMPLEFFVTQPLETLIQKRASFLATKQQHRRPDKWYDGLFSLWDTRLPAGQNLLGPDHLAGQPPYAVSGSDDPCNGKSLFLAEKNVAYPDAREIEALEYFVEHFVWGKQQRTDQEQPFPYGIYGADNWRDNRFAKRDPLESGVSRPGGPGQCRMWRTFDYTTYFALYFDLYRIARQNPGLLHHLDAATCLERAFGTARAYFEVPRNLRMEGGWSFTGWVYWQYTVGNFHEKYLLPLIAALETEGQQAKADLLRGEWEKKVKYFIYDNPWPFVSEMPIDSTAYESTYAAGRYALSTSLNTDTNLWQDRNCNQWYSHPAIDLQKHARFLLRQHLANLACRGVLEMNYWSLGSDFRGCGSAAYTLSYMSQMGGWAVLDYALRFDPDPADNLRLGFASMLSSWALLNTGDPASNYGFWSSGLAHDGAAAWAFQPRQTGSEWNPAAQNLPRGAWPVDGEIDHGLTAGIEAARTVVFDDPVFGMMAYGGQLETRGSMLRVWPRDGVRQRLSAVLGQRRLHLSLDRDGFARQQPLELSRALDQFEAMIEDRAGFAHAAVLEVEGLPPGAYRLGGCATTKTVSVQAGQPLKLRLAIKPGRSSPLSLRGIR